MLKLPYIKKKLVEIDEEIKIHGRDNIGGTTTMPNSNEGVLPHCLPNEFFLYNSTVD